AHLEYIEKRKATSFMLMNEILNLKDKRSQRKMLALVHKYLKRINAILLEGVRTKQFRGDINLTSAAILFFGMIQSVSTLWALSGFKYSASLRVRLEDSFEVYTKGVLR
ncbi:MAG: hypothetical protein KKF80_04665, partial [Candidatus Omnitrophica bacterium]|nr:hypothetical protein [Candidatus Omnitrophota bacterium]